MKVWRRMLLGSASAILACMFLALILEGVLRWVGYGYPTSFFLNDPNSGMVIENERFVWQFLSPQSHLKPHPFRFDQKRKQDAIRIFVLGESAALGTPEPSFSFSRVLERILQHRYPERSIEVINLAMRGINSHMVRVIAHECVAYDPSLIIYYGGNNELVGWQAPGPDSRRIPPLEWIRIQQFLRASKSGQLIQSVISSMSSDPAADQDMAFFHNHRLHPDDMRRQWVMDCYTQNLKETFEAVTARKIPLLVGTVVVNERDCPPLASLHREGLASVELERFDQFWKDAIEAESRGDWIMAASLFQRASEIDNRFAELHFRLARVLEHQNDSVASRFHYQQAKDCDALPFRGTSSINAALKQVVEGLDAGKINLVDLDDIVRTHPSSMNEVPGSPFFYEHVHFRFNGDYSMASYLFPFIQQMLDLPRKEPSEEATDLPALVDSARQLGYNPVLEAMMIRSMIQLQKGPPFLDQVDHSQRIEAMENDFQKRYAEFGVVHVQGAIKWIQDAMQSHPNDWNLPFLAARLAARLKDAERAAVFASKARDLMPHASLIRITLAHYLTQSSQKEKARAELNEVLKRYPEHPEALAALGNL
ncbi:hypothetical protein OAK83_01860 [bacterium]|nr:hypothetical protein [bacterium]